VLIVAHALQIVREPLREFLHIRYVRVRSLALFGLHELAGFFRDVRKNIVITQRLGNLVNDLSLCLGVKLRGLRGGHANGA
jgi:hypothetical protein